MTRTLALCGLLIAVPVAIIGLLQNSPQFFLNLKRTALEEPVPGTTSKHPDGTLYTVIGWRAFAPLPADTKDISLETLRFNGPEGADVEAVLGSCERHRIRDGKAFIMKIGGPEQDAKPVFFVWCEKP